MSNKEKDSHQARNLFQPGTCQNIRHTPRISSGMIVAKMPVLLIETTVHIHVDGITEFPEPVYEIKQVKNIVKLSDATLLLPTNKLFIKGYVRKHIQYASPAAEIEPHTENTIASDIHSFTTDLPFHCVTEINEQDYFTLPVLPKTHWSDEYTYRLNEPVQTGNLSQYQHENDVYYNELPYCELLSSKVIDWNEAIDRRPFPNHHAPVTEGRFTKVDEKMVIELTLQVFQKQQVRVSSMNIVDENET